MYKSFTLSELCSAEFYITHSGSEIPQNSTAVAVNFLKISLLGLLPTTVDYKTSKTALKSVDPFRRK